MAKPTAQQCHAMTTYFVNEYARAQGKAPVVNRNKARWGFEAILMDHPSSVAKDLVIYYIEHYQDPSLEWFLFNYDKVIEHKEQSDKQQALYAARREQTEKRLEEWKNRWRK